MAAEGSRGFHKPRRGHVATCHLFVTRCGFVGDTAAAKTALQRTLPHDFQFPEHHITLHAKQDKFYVSVATPAAATAMLMALQHPHCKPPRLVAAYAAENKPLSPCAALLLCQLVASSREVDVPGMQLWLNFMSPAEEIALLECLEDAAWLRLRHRCVQQYGHAFDYGTRLVSPVKTPPMPPPCVALAARLCMTLGLQAGMLDQLTVNRYPPGAGIGGHVDTHSAFQGPIVAISLGSACTFVLQQKVFPFCKKGIILPARSCIILDYDSRLSWQHGIPFRDHDAMESGDSVPRATRTSLTFRTVRNTPCDCAFPSLCDSQWAPATKPTLAQLMHSGSLY